MKREKNTLGILGLVLLFLAAPAVCNGQSSTSRDSDFGPVVRAYLGYLKAEQEVVDDRASRHEIKRAYYLRNSNRIRALRQIALRIARESGNDYLPELEAAAVGELRSLFESPPKLKTLREGQVYSNKFRYLGTVRSGDTFYIFARLDPYEQAELMEKAKPAETQEPILTPTPVSDEMTSRPRRVGSP